MTHVLKPLGAALALGVAAIVALPAAPALAQGELNIYSSRHYDTDEQLYGGFERATGIKINRIEDNADVLMERIKREGANSPADILITVDAGRIYHAERDGLLQGIESEILHDRIPENLRHPDGQWFGFSTRARVIFYDRTDVANPPQTYEELADPRFKGQVCTRSGSNIYMLSLMAALIEHKGEDAAREWARGVWENRAREPQGGDTDQIRAIVSGECEIVLSNTYYFARALASNVEGLTGQTDNIGIVFPNQETTGTHVNISGAGVVANAPNRDNAIRFLEYLASPDAQRYFAEGNHEYPVVEGVAATDTVRGLGDFKADTLPLVALGVNQARAQQIYNEVGFK